MKIWVLDPNYKGKVVAEAYAGVNHRSRCQNDENRLCKKGQQLITVLRVFYKDMPVMFKKDVRIPKHISFLDQAEGLPNCSVLWGVCYLIQIPRMEEITRMMGNFTSSVCGRATSNPPDVGSSGRVPKSVSTRSDSVNRAKGRRSLPPIKKPQATRGNDKKLG
jgi:hypothetical protein